MKITYILPVYWPAIGGCELHTHELVQRLSERHDIQVITQITRQEDKPGDLWFGTLVNPLPKRDSYNDNKAIVIPIKMNLQERLFLYPFVRSKQWMEDVSMTVISHIFKKKIFNIIQGSDIVHCIHNGVSFYAYTAMQCSKELNIPFVITPLLQLYQALREKNMTGVVYDDNFIKIIDSISIAEYLSPMGYHDKFWLHACKTADALITMTEFEKKYLIKESINNADKIHEVGVGPLISEESDGRGFRKKHNIYDKKMILFLGRKHECKGFEEVLKAAPYVWERHPDTFFFFIGPKEGAAASIFKQYSDDRIVEIDEVTMLNKTSAIEACDILCMPSLYEALGAVFIEAWMFEKPIIAGDTPPVAELLGYGKGGELVNLKPRDIAEKIIRLLNNKALCKSMGAWGKNKVLSCYTWEIICNKIENIYQKLIEKKNQDISGVS